MAEEVVIRAQGLTKRYATTIAVDHIDLDVRAGEIVGIFPEGPFSVRGQLEPGLPGVGLLALRSGVPVIPAGIRGTFAALEGRRAYVPRRHPLSVRFGPPRQFVRERGRAARADVTQRIMSDIAALLC